MREVLAAAELRVVTAVLIGGLNSSLERTGDVWRLIGFDSVQDDVRALTEVIEAQMTDAGTPGQLQYQPGAEITRPSWTRVT